MSNGFYKDVNVRKLLDNTIDPIQERRKHYGSDPDDELSDRYNDSKVLNVYVNQTNTTQQAQHMTGTQNTNNLQGANIANFANEVKDNARQQANQHNYAPSQNLTQAAKEIKALLDEITTTDNTNNTTLIAAKAIEAIENNPSLKDRIINAGKEAGFAALDAAVDHPAVKIVTAAIKGAIEA